MYTKKNHGAMVRLGKTCESGMRQSSTLHRRVNKNHTTECVTVFDV